MSKYHKSLIATASGIALRGAPAIIRARTMDQAMQTFDQQTVDSAGGFLIGELERLDMELHMPLAAFTWSRDIDLREDITLADDFSSFTRTEFSAPDGTALSKKSWIGKTTTALVGTGVDNAKQPTPVTPWGMELGWSMFELAAAMQIGRPIDTDKVTAMNFKYNFDTDEQVYMGDAGLGQYGLLNSDGRAAGDPSRVTNVSNVPNGAGGSPLWAQKTPDEIVADVNTTLTSAWAASGYSYVPGRLLVSPTSLGQLVSQKVSTAGNVSTLEYVKANSLSNQVNGRPLEILPVKWLEAAGVGGTRRMVAYTKARDKVRFPLVPLQRTPLQFRGVHQYVSYYGRLGAVEVVYPELIAYRDGM